MKSSSRMLTALLCLLIFVDIVAPIGGGRSATDQLNSLDPAVLLPRLGRFMEASAAVDRATGARRWLFMQFAPPSATTLAQGITAMDLVLEESERESRGIDLTRRWLAVFSGEGIASGLQVPTETLAHLSNLDERCRVILARAYPKLLPPPSADLDAERATEQCSLGHPWADRTIAMRLASGKLAKDLADESARIGTQRIVRASFARAIYWLLGAVGLALLVRRTLLRGSAVERGGLFSLPIWEGVGAFTRCHVLQTLVLVLLMSAGRLLPKSFGTESAAFAEGMDAVSCLVILALLVRWGGRLQSDGYGPRSSPFGLFLGAELRHRDTIEAGMMLLGAYAATSLILALILPGSQPAEMTVREAGLAYVVLSFIGGVAIVPVIEEFLFRVILFGSLMTRMPALAAGVVAGMIFALLHDFRSVAELVDLTAFGLLMAMGYKITGSIVPPILCHAATNLSSFSESLILSL